MYDKEYGGLATSNDPGVLDIIKRIGTIVSLSKGYQNGFWNYVPGVNVALRLNDFWKILNECVGLFDDIVKFGVQVAKNIVGLFTSYDRLYYSSYMTYNLPCRVDLDEGKFNCKLMSGYDLNKAGLPKQGGVNNINPLDDFGDDLAALAQTLKDFRAGSGSDITFSGAELEYILFGSNSEIANQLYVFVAFLFCRLLTTIPAVLGNAEAELMAGATTIGYPVVMALLIIGETFVDTLLLVNGENLDFYERTIHLSPSGIVKLTADQLTIVGKKASNALKERFDAKSRVLKKKFEDTQGSERYQELKGRLDKDPYKTSDKSPVGEALESYKKSFGQFSYRDFCLVLLLLTVSENQQMTRLSNLIQMESLWYYTQTEPRDAGFDIRKAYAAIDAQAEVKISWSLPSVTGSSWLTANRRQVRGY